MPPASKVRRRCPTRFPTSPSTCTRRRSACRCCGGAPCGSTHTAYSTEFIDELAVAAGKDPVAFRAGCSPASAPQGGARARRREGRLGQAPQAGKPGDKRGRGIAVHESFNSYVAQVAEVTIGGDGTIRVDRVVCAVDCGIAVNPDNIRAQMEGGIGFGLSAALYGAITLQDGSVVQSNFHDYPVLRINEMPKVEVHIVTLNGKTPTGVGGLVPADRPRSPRTRSPRQREKHRDLPSSST